MTPKGYYVGDPVNFPPGLQPNKQFYVTMATEPTFSNPLPLNPPTYAETVAPLKYDEETSKGSIGWPVYALQAGLVARGFNLVADGIFGYQTKRKVMTFQENNGLTADGIVGPATKAKLVEKVALLVDEERPNLPNGLLRAMAKAEGGDNPAAINEYDPPTGPHGTDCGVMQIRCYEPYTMEALMLAFNPYTAMHEAANRFEVAKNKYLASYAWTKNNRVRSERCALLSHNWPVGANDIAQDGNITNPNGEAAWVPVGVKMLDGTVVNTRQEWCDFYAMGASPHCGSMPASVQWGV